MESVLKNLYTLVAPGRYCAVVVGDGIYRGSTYPTATRLLEIAENCGWITSPPIARTLPKLRRSVTAAGRRLKREEILVLRKPARLSRLLILPPSYERFPYEVDLGRRELGALTGTDPTVGDQLDVPPHEMDSAINGACESAFWHGVRVDDTGEVVPTRQCLLEDLTSARRKHSTYVTHGLHRYKGKFYPQLAKALLNLSGRGDGLALDPFGGSGTVMLESVLNGRDAVSVDCSPLATAVAQAKVDVLTVKPGRLTESCERVLDSVHEYAETNHVDWDQFQNSTHEELSSWFAGPVLAKISALLRVTRSESDPKVVQFFEVIVSDLIRDVSQQDPRDLRIRRRSEPLSDAPVVELFEGRATTAVGKVLAFHGIPRSRRRLGSGRAVLGNSADGDTFRVIERERRPIDVVVSSPPYATALPYIDTDRLSLAAVYGLDKKARRALEKELIGSRETSRTEQRQVEAEIASGFSSQLPDSTVTFLQALLDAVRSDDTAGFRRQQLPTVLAKYFLGVTSVMAQLRSRLRDGAHLWFVLGDSRTHVAGRRWVIPTVDEVEAIAKESNLEVIERVPITVTREDVIHAKHAITENAIVHLRAST
jgi:hypothetical protein